MSAERNWTITEINGAPMIATTLVDGTAVVMPAGEITLSEWVNRVKYLNTLALEALMEAEMVIDMSADNINVVSD